MIVGNTPNGMSISPETVERQQGGNRMVTRIMIRDAKGNILYGYRPNANETVEEAVEKWKDGTYAYHKS